MSDTDTTLEDAYRYVRGLVAADTEAVVGVQAKYEGDKLRDLMGASAGVLLGVFGNCGDSLKAKIVAGLTCGIDGDVKALQESVKAADNDLPTGMFL